MATCCLSATTALSGCGLVVHANDYTTKECVTNSDCIGAHGANFVCRPRDQTCQSLLSADCQQVIGSDNLKSDSTFLFGALLALYGDNSPTGQGELAALKMAYQDFATTGLPPLPGQTQRRQLAVLVCDDSASNDVALRSEQHMIDVGIQGIVGASWSGPTLNFLTQASLAAGVLNIGSGTTSPDLTPLQKNGLYYRTSESTALENPPIAGLVSAMSDALTKARPALKGTVKLALAYKGDSFGKGTVQSLVPILSLNGKNAADPFNTDNFLQIDYGNPSNPTADPLRYDDATSKIVAMQPQIVTVIGTGEMFDNIMASIEKKWPTGASAPPRPYYVFPHTGVSAALVTELKNIDPTGDLRKRVVGVTFGSVTTAFTQFLSNFNATQASNFSPYTLFANTTYDAFYTLVFSAVSLGEKPLTGVNLGAGISNLLPGPGTTKIKVGSQDLIQALSLLSSGQKIDMDGTSGALDFDTKTGDVKQENQVWCVPIGKDGAPAFPPFSGYGFDLDQKPIGDLGKLNDACGIVIK